MIEKKRLFLAIPIQPSIEYITIFERLKHRLRMDMISWIDPHTAHLTLKFFGETPVDRIDKIIGAISKGLENTESFNFSLDKIGAFGSNHSPKVLWLGLEEPEKVINLHDQLMKSLQSIRYFPDPGNFVPHITLGRVKKCTDKQWFWDSVNEVKNKQIQEIEANKLILFESILQRKGAIHQPITVFDLKSVI